MKRTTVTFTIGALLVAGTAAVAPTQAHALELGHHAPSVAVPAVHHAATASTHRTTTTDTQQVTNAILHSKLLGAVKPANVSVSQVKFAGAGHTWASALATPKNGQTDPAQVLLKKSGTSWTVRDLGTASIGCGIAPQAVRNTLGLHGPC
ncbi:hypothetical protein GCM10011492_07450 [Flexivirga endophytica]|uniref:Secreted protein n=1 Tax=Flexivirga endophytica TaxID=1849103 RepID=A0A916WQ74_9MICO|nr:hypothetical protein [Flexivirga endophytica]GGB20084.1 hypothetical protein GCM10011492_07450 [Flexivirga endophytica]GHB35597.1 hypothetical protein GCM10008112_00160 [Flexivirga endophytica]